jgi:hypothetical protein
MTLYFFSQGALLQQNDVGIFLNTSMRLRINGLAFYLGEISKTEE